MRFTDFLILENADAAALDKELREYEQKFIEIREKIISEEVAFPMSVGDIDGELNMVSKMFDAAKKGLGLVNKLPRGAEKAKHASRVMTNMNIIRAAIARIQKQLASCC